MDLDRIDIALLEHLQTDARATTLELSEKVGLSPSPCHRRQKLLEEAGIIRSYVALLDQEQVGLPVNVFVTVELAMHNDENLTRFEAAIAECPEVMEGYEMTGTSDYLLRVVCADLASYEKFMRARLTRIEGVRAIRSAFALKRVIYRTNLPLTKTGK
jgi:Lrp/AsnC family leucine-responsive transcriptional regulator